MLPLFHDNFILVEATSSHFFWVTTSTQQLLFRVSYFFFFLSGFSFTDTDDPQDSSGREGTIFYSTLPLPSAHEDSDIYVQLCAWDDYHRFLIATLTFTRLLLDEIYHLTWLIDLVKLVFVCLLDDFMSGFCYSNLDTAYQWTRTLIHYHPCITSEPTNQVS